MTNFLLAYPDLFREVFWAWGPMFAQFALYDFAPTPISNVNLIPYTHDGWLVLRLTNGEWTMPGGTLEPGESYIEALNREMLEEAGARVVDFHPLGAWKCRSLADKPFRPHLPHPLFYRFVCVGEVELIAQPSNPMDAEQVASVEVLPLEAIVRGFRAQARPEMAQLYQVAAQRAARA